MPVVVTEFDNTLEEDIILEEVDDGMASAKLLKSAENIFKANIYLKKLFSASPTFNEVLKFETIETSGKEAYAYNANTSLIMFKNLRDEETKIYIGQGYLVLLPFESFEFPITEGMIIEIDGRVSVVETKYE
jgi:hypothetical protein